MMLFLIVIYCVFLLVLYKASPMRGDASIFGFRKLFFLIAVAELPYVIAVAINPEILHPRVLARMRDFEEVFTQFLLMKALFLTAFTFTAFHIGNKVRLPSQHYAPAQAGRGIAVVNLQFSMVLLLMTLATFGLLLQEVGGISVLLQNWSTKTEVLRGTAVYRTANLAFGMLSVGFYISYLGSKRQITLSNRLILAMLIITVVAVLLSVGERKNPVLVVVFAIVLWHFRVRPINVIRPSYVALLFLFLVFAAVFPELRRSGGTELLLADPATVLAASADNWSQFFARMSDVETSLFIYSHFDSSALYWYGASYLDLLTGIVPAQLMPDKPPVDEGVYIYALSFNMDIVPPVPFHALIPVGWPVSRVTGPFVHFGAIGVLAGGFLTGFLMRRIHQYAFRTRSPSSIFVYVWAIFTGFGVTNAFIFNLIIILALIAPLELIYVSLARGYSGIGWQKLKLRQR